MKKTINKGDSVAVKKGIVDPDYGNSIEGWTGIVIERTYSDKNELLVRIQWDSKTLKQMSRQIIEQSEKQGLDWTGMYLKVSDTVRTRSKIKEKKHTVTRAIENISKKHKQLVLTAFKQGWLEDKT